MRRKLLSVLAGLACLAASCVVFGVQTTAGATGVTLTITNTGRVMCNIGYYAGSLTMAQAGTFSLGSTYHATKYDWLVDAMVCTSQVWTHWPGTGATNAYWPGCSPYNFGPEVYYKEYTGTWLNSCQPQIVWQHGTAKGYVVNTTYTRAGPNHACEPDTLSTSKYKYRSPFAAHLVAGVIVPCQYVGYRLWLKSSHTGIPSTFRPYCFGHDRLTGVGTITKLCRQGTATKFSTLTALVKATGGQNTFGVSAPSYKWTGEATSKPAPKVLGLHCTANVQATKKVTFTTTWTLSLSGPGGAWTAEWNYGNGVVSTLTHPATTHYAPTGEKAYVTYTYPSGATNHEKVEAIVTRAGTGTITTATRYGSSHCWITVTLSKLGVITTTSAGTLLSPKTLLTLTTSTATVTCTTAQPLVQVTCTYIGPTGSVIEHVWHLLSSLFTPFKDVVCPVTFAFVPTKCVVHQFETLVGFTPTEAATNPNVKAAHPATQWVGWLVKSAATAPDDLETGLSSGSSSCSVPTANLTTHNPVTFCAGLTSAVSDVHTHGGWDGILSAVTGVVFSLFMLIALVEFVRRTLSKGGP